MTNGTPIEDINAIKADIVKITQVSESEIEFMDFQEQKNSAKDNKSWKKNKKPINPKSDNGNFARKEGKQ